MDKYYLLIFGVAVLIAVIYFVLNQQGSGDGDAEIQKHLAKGEKKKPLQNKATDFNDKSHGAKSGGLLDGESVSDSNQGTLATWVDSEDYKEPEKLVTTSTVQKVKEQMKSDEQVVENKVNFLPTSNNVSSEKIHFKPQILLVDDSLTVRTLLGKLLAKSGEYDVILKENGWEALSYLNGNYQKPDLIITDMQMPEMDGFELIDAVREKAIFVNVPIIAISSVFEPEDHLELLELEKIQGFIKKQNPFDENDLLQQITYLMNNFY